MTRLRRIVRQTLTIARRDFTATVFAPTFLLFLFAPLITLSFGAIGGVGASVASSSTDKSRIIAIVAPADAPGFARADDELRDIFRDGEQPPELRIDRPKADPARQAHATFAAKDVDARAALYGSLERPTILYDGTGTRSADYLAAVAERTLRDRAGSETSLSVPVKRSVQRTTGISSGGKHQAAFFGVFGIFLLTIILAGQTVGTMAEERSNKVIEVLAAAVPLESVFLGKLLGMLGMAIVFVVFWGTLVSNVGVLLPAEVGRALHEIGPAVGFPTYAVLFFVYFTMAYMLLGAVFLGVGAQASTMREIQMLSLPITIVEVAMFGLSSIGASSPDSWVATFAEIFPFSSPFAMAARAANSPEIWPHAAAIAWQLLWVTIVIFISARAFRRGVLQSGNARWFSRRKDVTQTD